MFYLLAALVLYTFAILIGSYANRRADTNVVSAVINTISAVVPILVVAVSLARRPLQFQRAGLVAAVVGGVTIALFTMALNKSFATDKVAIVSPIVFGGAIFLSTLLSMMIFKDKISLAEGLGLALMGAGLVVVIYARATGR